MGERNKEKEGEGGGGRERGRSQRGEEDAAVPKDKLSSGL